MVVAMSTRISETVRTYISACSSEDIDIIMKAIKQLPPRKAFKDDQCDIGSKPGMTGFKINKKQCTKAVKRGVTTNGPKRPLNSFMAFRKYYSGSLAPNTQKAISKILTTFWHEDPFEAKWAILAKAYSILRGDHDKDSVPLEEFFEICAPLIGVIPPQHYMLAMGWQLNFSSIDQKTTQIPQITRLFVPDLDKLPQHFTTSLLSVDDLVKHCAELGFVAQQEDEARVANWSLSMVVQSRDQSNVKPRVNPTENSIDEGNMLPRGASQLLSATRHIEKMQPIHHAAFFDPAGDDFDLSYDPVPADGSNDKGIFDAYDIDGIASGTKQAQMFHHVDLSEFVNDI